MTETISCPKCGLEVNRAEKACPRCNSILTPNAAGNDEAPRYPSLDENSGRVRQLDSGQTDR